MKANDDEIITIINPVRIAPYTRSVDQNIYKQYQIIHDNHLPATWLLTFDIMNHQPAIREIKKFDNTQEVGLFIEVSPELAKASNVEYKKSSSWHYANSIFLTGYTQSERKKIIDTLFQMYKSIFNSYPKSVGAWWVDSYSLEYMKKKYEITTNLDCSDQQNTDGYTIRGQYWSTPFYPSRFNAAMPGDIDSKIGVVTLQWAPRDPEFGYLDSRYSTQDYFTSPGKDINYFLELVNLYARKGEGKLGQVVIGLESDFNPDVYSGEFKRQINASVNTAKNNNFQFMTMSGFAKKYVDKFPDSSPLKKVVSATGNFTWINTINYRIGYKKSASDDTISIVDLRIYDKSFYEPYYTNPNGSSELQIHVPAVIDSIRNSDEIWTLPKNVKLTFTDSEIILDGYKNAIIPNIVRSSLKLNSEKNRLTIYTTNTSIGAVNFGQVIQGWSAESKHFFSQWRFPLQLLNAKNWKLLRRIKYLIPSDEVVALQYLASLPAGTVLVPDKECLQCSWADEFPPPVFGNDRSYVQQISKKKLIKNNDVFDAIKQDIAKQAFIKSKAKYIYLVRHGEYKESIPFSPGDIGVKKIFENAYVQIWKKVS